MLHKVFFGIVWWFGISFGGCFLWIAFCYVRDFTRWLVGTITDDGATRPDQDAWGMMQFPAPQSRVLESVATRVNRDPGGNAHQRRQARRAAQRAA